MVAAAQSPAHHCPHLRAIVIRVAVTVATAVIAPAVLFTSTMVLLNLVTAVLVALSWMAGAMCWRWATERPVSGLLLLTLGLMTAKTAFLLATGNTFVYFIQPVFVDAAVAGRSSPPCGRPSHWSPGWHRTSTRWTRGSPRAPGCVTCSAGSP